MAQLSAVCAANAANPVMEMQKYAADQGKGEEKQTGSQTVRLSDRRQARNQSHNHIGMDEAAIDMRVFCAN